MMRRGKVVGYVFLFSGLLLTAIPAHARQFTIGTLAYSWLADGDQNIYIQGSLSDRSAWFFDKCNSDGETLTAWYKRYRNKVVPARVTPGQLAWVMNTQRKTILRLVGMLEAQPVAIIMFPTLLPT